MSEKIMENFKQFNQFWEKCFSATIDTLIDFLKLYQENDVHEVIYTGRDKIEFTNQLFKQIEYVHPEEKVRETLGHLIYSANKSVYIIMNSILFRSLIDHLCDAATRGVDVLIMLNKLDNVALEERERQLLERLDKCGATIKFNLNRKSKMNLRICLIDIPTKLPIASESDVSKRRQELKQWYDSEPLLLPESGIAIIGSMDWTQSGMMKNEENFLITSKKHICDTSMRRFEEIWKAPDFTIFTLLKNAFNKPVEMIPVEIFGRNLEKDQYDY